MRVLLASGILLATLLLSGTAFGLQTVDLGFDKTLQLDGLELYFYDIEDSRCPLDVTCFWEGQVTAMIQLSNQTHTVDVHFSPEHTVTFFPYEITLDKVMPHPTTTEKPDYVATLEVTKVSEDKTQAKPDPGLSRGETMFDSPVIIIIQVLALY